MLRYLRIAFGTLVMLTVMALAAGITLRLALHAGEVSIPNFAGLTVQEASNAALRAGLDLNINNKFYSTTVPAGRILSQAPSPGSEVRKGWQVRVTESLGPQDVAIPEVVGQPIRQATMDLRRNQLDLGAQARLDAPGDPDFVLAQTPPPNAGVDQPRVNLLLSTQAQDASTAFVMPSFVGQGYTSANHQAIVLGLRVATIGGIPATPPPTAAPLTPEAQGALSPSGATTPPTPPPAPATPVGPILSQSPEAGHHGTRGQTIKFYFSRPSTQSSTSPAATVATVPTTPAPPQ